MSGNQYPTYYFPLVVTAKAINSPPPGGPSNITMGDIYNASITGLQSTLKVVQEAVEDNALYQGEIESLGLLGTAAGIVVDALKYSSAGAPLNQFLANTGLDVGLSYLGSAAGFALGEAIDPLGGGIPLAMAGGYFGSQLASVISNIQKGTSSSANGSAATSTLR